MGLLGSGKLVVGYDLGGRYSQISYSFSDKERVETLSQVLGEENYNIPTVLCKRPRVNQWFYGNEALDYARENEGILVPGLLQLALDGEEVQIEGRGVDPVALLTLFVKRSLGLLLQVAPLDKISALVITCGDLSPRMLEVLQQVAANLNLKTDRVYFQSYMESFYHYMLYQPPELWTFCTVLCDYGEDCIHTYRMECNERTTPTVAFVEQEDFPFPVRGDHEFLEIAENFCNGKAVSSVYLIGEQFAGGWMQESLRFLCKGRRVFQGSNLFSKGACFGMLERIHASEAGRTHVFLGGDKLKSNIGMNILRRGEESYYALLDAGVNWYEAEKDLEFYLQEGNAIEVKITSLTGGGTKEARVVMDGLEGSISRIGAHFFLSREDRLNVELRDLGFGEIRPATGGVWKEEIDL